MSSQYRKSFSPHKLWCNVSPLVNGTEVLWNLSSAWEGHRYLQLYFMTNIRTNQICFWVWQELSCVCLHDVAFNTRVCTEKEVILKACVSPNTEMTAERSAYTSGKKTFEEQMVKWGSNRKFQFLHKLLNRNLKNNLLSLSDTCYCQNHVVGFINQWLSGNPDVRTSVRHR